MESLNERLEGFEWVRFKRQLPWRILPAGINANLILETIDRKHN
jgi:hypothetical protein